jgi:hypothetical protein
MLFQAREVSIILGRASVKLLRRWPRGRRADGLASLDVYHLGRLRAAIATASRSRITRADRRTERTRRAEGSIGRGFPTTPAIPQRDWRRVEEEEGRQRGGEEKRSRSRRR